MAKRLTVALLIWNPQNHAMLAELLREEYDVLPRDRDLFSPGSDLLIVDGPALATSGAALRAAKTAAEPLFLPVLFVASRPDVMRASPGLWDVIDDVIMRPLVKRELRSRIRALLRARRLSLRLNESLKSVTLTNEKLRETRMLYEREHLIAERLQHAALPNVLPAPPGFSFDGFYESATEDTRVGGDWYDAMCLNDGRMVISIGDVSGAGLEAAVTMASMRQAIRAVAQIYADPATMLDAADRTLKEEQPGRIVTALVGVVDPIAYTLTYACAGHPRPYLRHPDGRISELEAGGLPLGLRTREDGANATVALEPESMLVFYTDGLSEATRDVFEGERRVRRALEPRSILASPHPAAVIKDAVYDGEPQRDDVAILTLRVDGASEDSGLYRYALNSDDYEAASRVRRAVVAELARCGVPEERLFTCELVFGELLGNVVRYAPGDFEVVLDLGGHSAVLHFLDQGKGFTLIPRLPTDLLSENGRGLYLIWTLSEDFNVDVRPGGGAHARAVLPARLQKTDFEKQVQYAPRHGL